MLEFKTFLISELMIFCYLIIKKNGNIELGEFIYKFSLTSYASILVPMFKK